MLRLLNKVIEKRYFESNGALGISVDKHGARFLTIRQGSKKSKMEAVYTEKTFSDNKFNFSEFDDVLSHCRTKRPLCYITLSRHYADVKPLLINQLPKSISQQNFFLRWRLEQDYGKSQMDNMIGFERAGQLNERSNIFSTACCSKNTIETLLDFTHKQSLPLQLVSADSLNLLKVIAKGAAFQSNYVMIHATACGWTFAVASPAGTCYYLRSRDWLEDISIDDQEKMLAQDIIRVVSYFIKQGLLEKPVLVSFIGQYQYKRIENLIIEEDIQINHLNIFSILELSDDVQPSLRQEALLPFATLLGNCLALEAVKRD